MTTPFLLLSFLGIYFLGILTRDLIAHYGRVKMTKRQRYGLHLYRWWKNYRLRKKTTDEQLRLADFADGIISYKVVDTSNGVQMWISVDQKAQAAFMEQIEREALVDRRDTFL